MIYGIIAAGFGSRLRNEGISVPKPLVEIGGECLLDRLIRIFMDNEASEIVVICNDRTALVASHLAMLQRDGLQGRRLPLRFKARSTPSSMHSFHELSGWLRRTGEPFILTTVDTVFAEREFARFVRAFGSCGADGLMGVTGYIEDEKPLYVGVDEAMGVTGFYDEPHDCSYISAGVYGLRTAALDILDRQIESGVQRMRNFQRALLRYGQRLQAFPFGKVIDIDHITDIEQARRQLSGETVAEGSRR